MYAYILSKSPDQSSTLISQFLVRHPAGSMPAAKVFIGKQVVPSQGRRVHYPLPIIITLHTHIYIYICILLYITLYYIIFHCSTLRCIELQKVLHVHDMQDITNQQSPELASNGSPRAESVLYTSEEHIEPTWLRHCWGEGPLRKGQFWWSMVTGSLGWFLGSLKTVLAATQKRANTIAHK